MAAADPGNEQQADRTDRRLVADRYRLNTRIGRGRIGDIYEADDEQYRDIDRHVAIQLLPAKIALNKALFSRLELGYAEIRAASHPNIVSYFDIGHDGRFGYLVMDHLDGASLRFILDDATTLSLDEANPVIRAVGDALQFLHAKSIVHGQLTAENVFVTDKLDIRLLDVVPLDSTSATLRGATSTDPFSRYDIEDDVYGLGCLAYEILAGRHPFNFLALADARRAGVKLTRIDSLPEKQWDALCRVLSFDRERQTPTVAEFLHEFGITGTERLQPEAHSAAPPPSARASNQLDLDNRVDPPIGPIAEPDIAGAKRKGAKRLPSPILVVALVGLGIWFGYGEPRNDIVTLTDYVDSYRDGGITESGDGDLPINVSDPAPAPSIAEDAAGTETTGVTDEIVMLPADEQIADSGADAPRSDDDAEVDAEVDADVDAEVDAPAGAADVAGASQSEAEFTLVQSYVTISERDVAARITARHPGNLADRVFWWTGDQTAIADRDYVPMELPVEGFTSGEVVETLHIPLINDSLAEEQETFYVFLGRHDAELGRLEPILRVRVDIIDDD